MSGRCAFSPLMAEDCIIGRNLREPVFAGSRGGGLIHVQALAAVEPLTEFVKSRRHLVHFFVRRTPVLRASIGPGRILPNDGETGHVVDKEGFHPNNPGRTRSVNGVYEAIATHWGCFLLKAFGEAEA